MIVVLRKKQYLCNLYETLFSDKNFIVIAHVSNIKFLLNLRLNLKFRMRILKNNGLRKLNYFFSNVFSGLTVMFILPDLINLNDFFIKFKEVLPLFCKYNNYFFTYGYLYKYSYFVKYSSFYVIRNVYTNFFSLFKYLVNISFIKLFFLCRR